MTLREAREKAGLTLSAVRKNTGIRDVTLRNWENGSTRPNPKKLPKLAAVYGVSLDELMESVEQFDRQKEAADTERTERAENPEPAREAPEPETIPAEVLEATEPEQTFTELTMPEPDVMTVTDEDYLVAAAAAVEAMKNILGDKNTPTVMLAVGFVTAEIENRLFIKR